MEYREYFEKAKAFVGVLGQERLVELTEHQSMAQVIASAEQGGFCGIGLPTTVGGGGLNHQQCAEIYEGLAYGDPFYAFMVQLHNNVTLLIERLSPNGCRDDIVKEMIAGKKTNAFAFTEGGSGSDPATTTGRAEWATHGYFVSARKEWIANGGRADYFVLITKVAEKKDMIMMFADGKSKGLACSQPQKLLVGNSLAPTIMEFESFFVPHTDVLSERGFSEALTAIDLARIFVPAMCIGLARRALDITQAYLAQREAFGGPILKKQAIQWSFATMEAELEAARLLVYQVASVQDAGEPVSLLAAKSKLLAPKLAAKITETCMQYWGGQAFAQDSQIHRLWVAARLFGVVDGTNEIQQIVLGREIEGRNRKNNKKWQL